jgi:hypothetical protein
MTGESPANHVTFNSITNNPQVGDERNFVRIRETSIGNYANEIALQPGKTYQIVTFFHNNAKHSLNNGGKGIAKDVSIKVQAPSMVRPGERGIVSSTIFCSNAEPLQVWDEAYVTAATPVELKYVSGSARVTSNGAVNGQTLPPSLFTSGALLGYDRLDGTLPGCAQYAGMVVYQIATQSVTTPVPGAGDTNDSLAVPQQKAQTLLYEQDYAAAYSAFTSLRKLRARREGTSSRMYLSNLRSSITCLRLLHRYNDVLPLAKELSQASDRALGPTHADSIEAKTWWAASAQRVEDAVTIADLHIELADAHYTNGDILSAERAMATAVYFENKALNGSGDATKEIADKATNAENSEKLKTMAKKVGVGALTAGATAAIESAVGQIFN